jgi:hypothetical protein
MEKGNRNMGFAIKEYVYLKNRILPNLAKNLKQTLLCTSTVEVKKKKKNLFAFLSLKVVVVWSNVDISQYRTRHKVTNWCFLKREERECTKQSQQT